MPIRWVQVRDVLGACAPCALRWTELTHKPRPLLTWFVRRWRREVTFEESPAPRGIATPRQWRDLAVARAPPVLCGVFSLVTLMANTLVKEQTKIVRTAAW